MTAYGTFTCQTIALEISASDELKLVVDSVQQPCLNTNMPADCKLSQEQASSPTLSSVAMSGSDDIVFAGVRFPASGNDVSCRY